MSQNEIVSETNYYPFGLAHKGYNEHVNSTNLGENWKYQGQERTTDMNLNIDEWKYRVSDPAIGRFWQIDPLAEDYYYNSTYAFQENKLGMGTELEGKELQLAPWLLKDAAKNSSGVGAHALGFGQGVVNSVEGTINALSDPVQTLSTMGELLSPGLAPNTTQIGLGMAVADGANKLVNGNGFERGEVIGGLATAVVGTKGTTAATKAISISSSISKAPVFWSGSKSAKSAATNFAKNNGFKTLEMTTPGRVLNAIDPVLPNSLSRPIWDGLSKNFAKGAGNSEINVFHSSKGVRINSTWKRVEYPIVKNKNLIYHTVK